MNYNHNEQLADTMIDTCKQPAPRLPLSTIFFGSIIAQALLAASVLAAETAVLSSDTSPRVHFASAQQMRLAEQPSASIAGYFTQLYDRAKAYDPAYQAALADFEAARIQATATLFALAPDLRISESFLENENSSRRTIGLSQPLFSIERIATFKETDARTAQAQANLKIKEFDLAQRLLKGLGELIKANEGLKTNGARIRTLENEVERTQLEFKLGKGTITDVRDTQVRLDQAKASDLSLKSRRLTALATVEAIIGEPVDELQLTLLRKPKSVKLDDLLTARQQGQEFNPGIINAASNERLAELAHMKARGAYLPQVGYTISRTERGNNNFSSQGFTFSFPLQASGLINVGAAAANMKKASAVRRQVEEQVRVDVQKFHTLVDSGVNESNQRLEAINSAELSVEANEASFKGGVRTRIDVLNTIQTLFQVNEEYVNSVVSLAENYLGLNTQTAVAPEKAVADVERLLFR